MTLKDRITRNLYPVAGTDCEIWIGRYANKSEGNPRRFCYLPLGRGPLDVRAYLYGNPERQGFRWVTPVCGNGRCLTADHQAATEHQEGRP